MRTVVGRDAVGALLVAHITVSRLALPHSLHLDATKDNPVGRRFLVREQWRAVQGAAILPPKALFAERVEALRELGGARAGASKRLLAHCTLRAVLAGEGSPLGLWQCCLPARPITAGIDR